MMRWCSELSDEELLEEYQRVCDKWDKMVQEDNDRSGSPLEGTAERLEECEIELTKRGLLK